MSEQVEQRLVVLLGEPRVSPYGNPIPGLDHLGVSTPPVTETHADLVGADVAAERGGRFEVRRIIEVVQNLPEVMALLHAGGVVPGAVLQFSRDDGGMFADNGVARTGLGHDIAHGIHVRPTPPQE